MVLPTLLTAGEFEEWVRLPENRDLNFEYIAGQVVQVVSNNKSSRIAMRLGSKIVTYLEQNPIGDVTGMDGGYLVGNDRYIPDVGFSYTDKLSDEAYNPNPPDLVIEVLLPSDSLHEVLIKVGNYLAVQTVVWLVYPEERKIEVFAPAQLVKTLTEADTLDGGTVLPGFSLPLKGIFEPIGQP